MGRTIAIVEDEPAIRANYAEALRRQGYDVAAFANRREAMAGMQTRLPDLAIIDIGLADEIDGDEAPRGLEDTLNFSHTGLPVHNMMQHSEVENSIEVFIRKRKFINTPDCKNNATLRFACESLSRAANLLRVKVESVDLTCAKLLQQYLHSNTPTASDIEYAATVKPATQLPQ